jgi:probable rRNA maturation factor
MSVRVAITDRAGGGAQARKARGAAWVKQRVREVLAMLGVTHGEWTITIVGDGAMAELHGRTRDLPTTTDVLTFDMRDETAGTSEGAAVELDTVVCADEAARRAGEMGHGVREELLLYAVHSLLHVQGYDDVTAAKARRMHEREDELLRLIGVGAVFARKGGKR